MHTDNGGNLTKSLLPLNLALRKYFPNSPFVGDILVVHINEDDTLLPGDWSLDSLLTNKKMVVRAVDGSDDVRPDSIIMILEKEMEFPPATLKDC